VDLEVSVIIPVYNVGEYLTRENIYKTICEEGRASVAAGIIIELSNVLLNAN